MIIGRMEIRDAVEFKVNGKRNGVGKITSE